MTEATNEPRVRINLAQGAKGEVKFDITAEFTNESDSVAHLSAAIDKVRSMCAEKGLRLADSAA